MLSCPFEQCHALLATILFGLVVHTRFQETGFTHEAKEYGIETITQAAREIEREGLQYPALFPFAEDRGGMTLDRLKKPITIGMCEQYSWIQIILLQYTRDFSEDPIFLYHFREIRSTNGSRRIAKKFIGGGPPLYYWEVS
jgi:hypothetical protein